MRTPRISRSPSTDPRSRSRRACRDSLIRRRTGSNFGRCPSKDDRSLKISGLSERPNGGVAAVAATPPLHVRLLGLHRDTRGQISAVAAKLAEATLTRERDLTSGSRQVL